MTKTICPRCDTFNGGIGGRPDSNFCYNCGLNLVDPCYSYEEMMSVASRAYDKAYAAGREDMRQDVLAHLGVE